MTLVVNLVFRTIKFTENITKSKVLFEPKFIEKWPFLEVHFYLNFEHDIKKAVQKLKLDSPS
jgi:hypothetical protein